MPKDINTRFNNDIIQIVADINRGDYSLAQDYFNKKVYKKYYNIKDANSDYFFFRELDEFLNNEQAKILNQTSKEKFISSYNDFLKENNIVS